MGQLNFIYSHGFGTTLGIYDQHRRSSGLNCDRDESSRFFFSHKEWIRKVILELLDFLRKTHIVQEPKHLHHRNYITYKQLPQYKPGKAFILAVSYTVVILLVMCVIPKKNNNTEYIII